ncbi:MAG: hypothetical protein IT207_01970 [Fimbriimonadaceae bacterium]|nr:hypothetical protein [Fimbriimonadaceae bacterium]
MVNLLFAFLMASEPVDSPVTEIALSHVSPMWALEVLGGTRSEHGVLAGDWIPEGVRVEADLERNTIQLEGDGEDVRTAVEMVRKVDVAPEQVNLDARIENSVIGRAWRTSTTLCNDQPLVISEETSGLKVEFKVQNRDDGLFDLFISNGRGAVVSKLRVRAQPGETFIYEEGRVLSTFDRSLNFDRKLPREIDGMEVNLISQEGAYPAGQRIAFQLSRVRHD